MPVNADDVVDILHDGWLSGIFGWFGDLDARYKWWFRGFILLLIVGIAVAVILMATRAG